MPPPTTRLHVPELDGIRAVAIAVVLFYHLGFEWCRGGYVGVDVFFVLSGYLISRGLVAELESGQFTFRRFYTRRFYRLFPALLATAAGILAAGALVLPFEPMRALGGSALWSVFALANVHFYRQSGYWDASSYSKPFLHFWSLSVEEQFYLVWPLLLWVVFSVMRGGRRALAWVFGLVGLLSLVAAERVLDHDGPAAFFMMPMRAWEFGLGGLLACVHRPGPSTVSARSFHALPTAVSALAVAGLIHASGLYSHDTRFPGLSALIPCVATGLLIACARRSALGPVLTSAVFRYVGTRSYAIYLVHWPLIVFYRDLKLSYAPVTLHESPIFTSIERVALVGGTWVLAELLHRFVEHPFRYTMLAAPPTRRARNWVLGGGSLAVVAIAALAIQTHGYPLRADQTLVEGVVAVERTVDCRYRVDLAGFEDACGIGVQKPEPEVVLLGDSHMLHFGLGFDELLRRLGRSGAILTRGGSLPIPGGQSLVLGQKHAPFDVAFATLLERRPRLVVLSGRWDAAFHEQLVDYPGILPNRFLFGPFQSVDVASSSNAVGAGLRRMLTTLDAAAIPTLVLGQVPLPARELAHCLSRPRYMARWSAQCLRVDANVQLDYERAVIQTLNDASASLAQVTVVDLVQALCRGAHCEVFSGAGRRLIYGDSSHLSADGGVYVVSQYIRPYVERALASNGRP